MNRQPTVFMPSYVSPSPSGSFRRLTGGIRYDYEVSLRLEQEGMRVTRFDLETLPRFARRFRFPAAPLLWRAAGASPDVLITDLGTSPLTLGLQSRCVRAGSLAVLICHHFRGHLEKGPFRKLLHRWCETRIVAGAGLLVANSPYTRRVLEGMGRDSRDIVTALPGLCVPPAERPVFRSDPENVLLVGNLEKRKGVLEAVKALDCSGLPGATLTVVGGDDLEPGYAAQVRNLAEQPGLAGRVRFPGRLGDMELRAAYEAADVFLLPSRWEGYGMAIAEAMATGLPVISTTAGAIPDLVVHGESGLLAEPGDWETAGLHLRRVFTDSNLRLKLARGALERAGSFPGWRESTGAVFQALAERLAVSSRN
jgi:glycosyltransferase involved in cell wall biosynthesis